jgi:hypothetical protein
MLRSHYTAWHIVPSVQHEAQGIECVQCQLVVEKRFRRWLERHSSRDTIPTVSYMIGRSAPQYTLPESRHAERRTSVWQSNHTIGVAAGCWNPKLLCHTSLALLPKACELPSSLHPRHPAFGSYNIIHNKMSRLIVWPGFWRRIGYC